MSKQVLNEAFNKFKAQQEQELVIDFDSAIEAQKKKAIKIKFRGRVYEVPPETPQWYMNIIQRKLHETKSLNFDALSEEEIIDRMEISDQQHQDIFSRLFGDEFVDEYLDENYVSMSVIHNELLNPILVKWGWKPAVDTTQKKRLTQES
jgi:hypothetical protein